MMGGAEIDLKKAACIKIVNVNKEAFYAGVSTGCNSAGTTGTISNQIVFCGGNNVTLSQSIAGQSATITIVGVGGTGNFGGISAGSQIATSGTVLFNNANNITFGMSNSSVITASASFNQTTQPSLSAGMSDLGYTAGDVGLVSNQLVFVGGSNVTLSQSIDAQSATLTIDVTDQSIQPSLSAGITTLGNTDGTIGTVSNQMIFVGGNNVTLSQSINANSATLTIDVIDQSTQSYNILAAGTQTAETSGTVLFNNANNITFGMDNSSVITASASFSQTVQPDAYNILSAGTQLANTTGTVLFQNSNSISFGMSDNSVITGSYELYNHDSVYHTGIIGAESQITFDPIAGHDHDGVDSKLIITPQYLEVSEAGGAGESGKQFTSIATAIAAAVAGGVGSAKPYVIRVYPGTYTEPQLVMVPYLAIIGSGMYNTIITASDLTNHFIIGHTNSYIRDCAIVGPTDPNMAAIYHDKVSTSPFTVQDVFIRQGYYGVWANSASTGGNVHCINVNNWYNGTAMHTFMYATNFGTVVAIATSFMCGPAGKITRGFACDGADAEIYMDLCSFRNTPTGPNPNDAVFVDNGGKVKIVASTFSIGTNAIHIGPNGTGGYVIAVGCNIRNEIPMGYVFTNDILMDSAGTLQFTGSCTKSKIVISNPAAASFSANFTDSTTGEEGAVVVGEMWLGFSVADSIPLRDYGLNAYSTGWRSGGVVTRSGAPPSLDLSVALGSGYVNTGTGVTRVSWAAITPITCTANSTQWIYVDSAGTVTISLPGTEPNYPDVIMLAVVQTDDTDVTFLANHNILLQQTLPSTYDFLDKVFGSIATEGCTVTQTAGVGNELKVDFTTGKYYSGLHRFQPATTAPITFTYWYRKVGSSGWNTLTPGGGGSDFDTTQYDNNSGALVALPGTKYKKDLLYVVENDVGTEFHVIYGQRYFDTLDQAEADTGFEIPYAFEDYALKLYGIVVLSGAGVIASIVDNRKKYVSTHNELKNLQGGNSATSQYYHLDYADYSARNQKIVASLLTAGNTAGAMAVISTGTMYLAGGNNVTLSQNANSVTISGPNIAMAAGGVTATGSTFTFGDKAGISFQISNGSIIGSVDAYLTSQSNQALSGSNTSFTFQTATFGSSNNMHFYVTNGSMVGSFSESTHDHPYVNTSVSSKFMQGWELEGVQTAGTTSSSQGTQLYLSGGNMLTLSGNSNTIVLSVNTASLLGTGATASFMQGWELEGVQTAGTTSSSQGTQLYLSGGNMMTLSGNSNTIVLSVNTASLLGTGTRQTIGLTNTTAGGSGAGTTGGASGNQIKYAFVAGSNITLSQSLDAGSASGTLSIYAAGAAAGIAAIGNTASSDAFTSGSVIFSGLTNITVNTSVNGASQYIQISGLDAAAAQGVSAIANSETTYTSGALIFSEYSNITISSSVDGASQYYIFSVVDPGGNAIRALSGSNTSISASTITFGSSNNMHFYVTNGSMVGSFSESTHDHPYINTSVSSKFIQEWQLIGDNTAGTTSSAQGSQLYLSGGNMMTLSGNNNTIVLSVNTASLLGTGATVSFMQTDERGNYFYTSNNTFANSTHIHGAVSVTNISATSASDGLTLSVSLQTQNILSPLAIVGNTAGTNYTLTQGAYSLSAGTNITLSQNSSSTNVIVLSVAGIQGIAGSGASTATIGTVQFQNSNGITFGLNGSTITASHNGLTSQSTAPSGLYASGIATTFTSGNIAFSGSNNITISTAAQAIIISGPVTHAVQTGISSIGATNTTYTSGGVNLYGSGIISLSSTTGQGFVISAPGVVSLNGSSSTLTLSAGNNMSISNVAGASQISIINVLSSSATAVDVSAASAAGTLSSRFALADHAHRGIGVIYASGANGANSFYGPITIATGNTNLTLSTGASALSIHGPAPGTGGIASIGVVGSEQTFTSGNVIFSGQANITLATSINGASQYIRISAPDPGAAGGVAIANSQTTFNTGTVDLLEGGGAITIASSAGGQTYRFSVPATSSLVADGIVSLSTDVSTITISVPGTTLSSYEPFPMFNTGTATISMLTNTSGHMSLFPLTVVQPVAAEYVGIIASMSFVTGGTSSFRQSGTLNWGLYTRPTGTDSTRISLAGSSSLDYYVTYQNSSITINQATTTNAGGGYGTANTNSAGLLITSQYTGLKLLLLGLNSTITPGVYWLGIHHRNSSSSFNSGIRMSMYGNAMTLTGLAPMGSLSSAYSTGTNNLLQIGGNWQFGNASYFLVNLTALTGDITMSNMTHNQTMMPYLKFGTRV